MKIALEVKNGARIMKPSKNNVILFDGKEWYVTTKQDIFAEYEMKIEAKLNALQALIDELAADNEAFKSEVSNDILAINKIVKKLYEEGE